MGKTHQRQSDDHIRIKSKTIEPKYLKGFDRINVASGLQALQEAELPEPLILRCKAGQQEKPHPHVSNKANQTCARNMPSDHITILPAAIIDQHCQACDTTFGCRHCLDTHLKSPQERALEFNRQPYQCCICGHVCKKARGLDSHSRAKHGISAKKAESREKKKRERTSNQPVPVKNDAAGGRIESVTPHHIGDSLVVAYNPTLGPVGEQFRRQRGQGTPEPKETLARIMLTEHQLPPKKETFI